jgi:hypothetical protein
MFCRQWINMLFTSTRAPRDKHVSAGNPGRLRRNANRLLMLIQKLYIGLLLRSVRNLYMASPVHVFICMTHGTSLGYSIVRTAHNVGVTTMKRLDQDDLHPLLEHPETNMSWPQASTLAKSYSNSL